uniref:Eukaryotic translation initiation factor 3 subunit G N-terminal domain-containing protein n=1 Tax=Panagrolaimus davidi TaxID=227884 RepID=A0A914PVV4_9BILA
MERKASEKTKCDYCSRFYADVPGHVQRQHRDKIQDEDMDGGNNSRRPQTPTTPIPKAGSKRNISAVQDGTSPTAIKKNAFAYTDFVNEKPGDRVLTCGYGEQLGHPGHTAMPVKSDKKVTFNPCIKYYCFQRKHPNKIQDKATDGGNNSHRPRKSTTPTAEDTYVTEEIKCDYCPNYYVNLDRHVQEQHRDKIQDVLVTDLPEDDDNIAEELLRRQFARAGRTDHVHVQRQDPNKIQDEDMDGGNNSRRSRKSTTPIAKATYVAEDSKMQFTRNRSGIKEQAAADSSLSDAAGTVDAKAHCQICKANDHWSVLCPYKQIMAAVKKDPAPGAPQSASGRYVPSSQFDGRLPGLSDRHDVRAGKIDRLDVARDKRKAAAVEKGTSPTAIKKNKLAKSLLAYTDFVNEKPGDRVLTCGYGAKLGHPGITTTKKPLAIATLPRDTKILQVVAVGLHTTILTDEHKVYSCGLNEFGAVPVKGLAARGITDKLTVIEFTDDVKKEGEIIQLTSGDSFTAALTHLGGVIAWGILKDEFYSYEFHHLFAEMQMGPTVIIQHNAVKIVKIAAGENHVVMLSSEGEIYTFGVGSMGQLGTSAHTKNFRSTLMADVTGKSLHQPVQEGSRSVKFSDIFAGGYWTMARATDGRIFACGLNNYGQLGFPLNDKENNFLIDRLTYSPAFPSKKKWTHIAGLKHIVARTDDGEVYGLGLNTDNELGIGTYKGNDDEEHWRYFELQKINFPYGIKIAGITARLGCSIAWTDRGYAYGFGYDSYGKLGRGNTDDKEKYDTTPKRITSAHLNGYKIISVTLGFQHSVFLATKIKNFEEDLGNFITDFVRPYNSPSMLWLKQTCARLDIPYEGYVFENVTPVRDITDRVPTLAALITGNEEHHGIIRRLIMQELIANKNPIFEMFQPFKNAKSLAKQKIKVDTTKECREEFWMDEPDIAAASHIFRCNIFVQDRVGWLLYNSTVYEKGHGYGTFIDSQPVLLLTNVSRKHFGAVV